MFAFILRRLMQAALVMVTVAFISFMLFQYVGDPVVFLLGQDATPEQVRELRAALGLDQPFIVQFWHFLANAAQGEFGLSLRQGAKVSRLIAERFPATLELAMVAAMLALAFGIPMGVYAALRRGTFLSQVFMTLSLLGVSLPTFLIGILLILVFAVMLGWFPSFGRGEVVNIGGWTTGLLTVKGWQHITLPAITLAIFQALMPLVGWFLGKQVATYIVNIDHWVAFLLLSILGLRMVYESFKKEDEPTGFNPLKSTVLIGMAIATSIDALVVGVSFAFINTSIYFTIIVIGMVTFLVAMIGMLFGKKVGGNLGRRMEIIGGIILVGIGVKILVEHTL
jgi:putative Mn2+ efflux pump MntP